MIFMGNYISLKKVANVGCSICPCVDLTYSVPYRLKKGWESWKLDVQFLCSLVRRAAVPYSHQQVRKSK